MLSLSWNRALVRLLLSILLLVAVSRAVLLFTGYVGVNLFSSYEEPPVYEQLPPGSFSEYRIKLPELLSDTKWFTLKEFAKFDSYSYMNIATQGYDRYLIDEPHPPANWVFFPLYPLIVSLTAKAIGIVAELNPIIVGLVVSNLLFFIALFYLYRIGIQQGLSERGARTLLLLVVLYPTSLFFSLPYTESLFFLLSAAAIYYATDKRYALAFAAAGLSTVARVPGFINLFFVAGVFFLNEGYPFSWKLVRGAVYSVLSLIPMGIYLFYMKWLTGDFLAPFHEQVNWFRLSSLPFENYFNYFRKPYFIAPGGWDNGLLAFVMSTAVFAVYFAYAALFWKKLFRNPKELLLYVCGALLLVIPFSSQPWYLASVVRYMMVCIPFYIYLVRLSENRESLLTAYMILFGAINALTVIGFFNGYYFMA